MFLNFCHLAIELECVMTVYSNVIFLAFQSLLLSSHECKVHICHLLGQIELTGNRNLKIKDIATEVQTKPQCIEVEEGKWTVKPAKNGDILMLLVCLRIGLPVSFILMRPGVDCYS